MRKAHYAKELESEIKLESYWNFNFTHDIRCVSINSFT